ncbi:MAG: hypothetical protein J5874_03900 [Oscillospiraceae bacterium]|nr:hypothetical protein [Oscillospiraceae bacterium]
MKYVTGVFENAAEASIAEENMRKNGYKVKVGKRNERCTDRLAANEIVLRTECGEEDEVRVFSKMVDMKAIRVKTE